MMWSSAVPALLLLASPLSAPAARDDDARCSVSGSAAAVQDEARALAACAIARARFALLFGAAVPRAHVVLHDEPQYEVALVEDVGVVFWPNSALVPAGARPRGSSDSGVKSSPTS